MGNTGVCSWVSFALPPTPLFVVWLRRFPTLPHPVGCSTIGVVGLSFRVRNVAGRFPNTMTTASLVYPLPTPHTWCVFWGVCGLDVIRIVVVSSCLCVSPLIVCVGGGLCLVLAD